MAALPENDRIAGPFIAEAGQVDFAADFPLIDPAGIRVRREREGVVSLLSSAQLEIISPLADKFTCRLTEPAQAGDRFWVISQLAAARNRTHTPNGAVKTSTLEADAESVQAQLLDLGRGLNQAIILPPGAAGGEVSWSMEAGERFLTIGPDGQVRAAVRPQDFNGLGALQKDGGNLYDEAERAALRHALGQASAAEAMAPVADPAAKDAGRAMSPETTLLLYGAAARELSEELPFGQFLGVRGASGHHWGDADHTPLLNAAIDKLVTVNPHKGGTIRLPSGRLNLGVVQPIVDDGVWIKGVAGGGRPGVGTAIKLLPGAGDLFTWGDMSGAGYQSQGGGVEDLYIEGDIAGALTRTGLCIVVNRNRFHQVNRVIVNAAAGGYRSYGGLANLLMNSIFDQMRGGVIEFVGDAAHKGDALGLSNLFVGAANAGANTRHTGILWRGFAHSLRVDGVQIVNPRQGVWAHDDGLSDASDYMRPHYLRAQGLEVDFAEEECLRFDHFRDFELTASYLHSMGATQAVSAHSHMVAGSNRNGSLRIKGGIVSNGGNFGQIYVNCNDSLIEGVTIQPPNGAGRNGVFVGAEAEKTRIRNCGIGSAHVYVNPADTVGVRVAAGARSTSICGNDFHGCTPGVVDAATSGQTFTNGNKEW